MYSELLTVGEFSKAVGISKQAVYKQMKKDGRLNKYVVREDNINKIRVEAIKEFYKEYYPENNQVKQPNQPENNQVKQPNQPENNQVKQPNQPEKAQEFSPYELIEFLKGQIIEKDRQIERIQEEARKKEEADREQISSLLELLKNAQHLQAQSNLLLHENNPTPQEQSEEKEVIETAQKEQEAPKKKKSLWQRLFNDD